MVDPLDVVSMILMKLEWEADFSAFLHWLVVGFLVATIDIKMRGVYKGLLLAVLTLVPIAFLVWGSDSGSVIPMLISTIIFGGLLGFLIDK